MFLTVPNSLTRVSRSLPKICLAFSWNRFLSLSFKTLFNIIHSMQLRPEKI